MDDQSASGNVMIVTSDHHNGGFQFNQVGHVNSSINRKSIIPNLCILLDNQSTIDVFATQSYYKIFTK
jgi:hypothetical protein